MRSTGGAAASGNPCMSDSDRRENEAGVAAPAHDASMRVDPRTLSSDEQDFARMMGFGDDAETPTEVPPARRPAAKKSAPKAPVETDTGSESTATSADGAALPDHAGPSKAALPETHAAPVALSSPTTPALEVPPSRPRDWEEIHPRAAALGRQAALVERADRVARLEPDPIAEPSSPDAAESNERLLPTVDVARLRARLQASEARIAELEASAQTFRTALDEKERALASRAHDAGSEKEAEALRLEVDGLAQECDRLGDALAAANTARSEARARADRLEAALRAAHGPSGPVPDGERDLRAEVVGLRRRLEETTAESRRLRESVETQATDLAIARAHCDDRQDELDQQRQRIDSLEHDRAAHIERLDEALVRQRELLALVSRVQAENVELRSTQAALEETLEARDLEISAREEHLLVTRRGLAVRDEQLIDAAERLEQARHRHELLEAELERARLGQVELEDKLQRREARVTSLSQTLSRIEDAIDRTVPRSLAEDADPQAQPAAERPQTSVSAVSRPMPAMKTCARDPGIPASGPAPDAYITATPAVPAPMALPTSLVAWRDERVRILAGEQAGVAGFLAGRLFERLPVPGPSPIRILSLAGARPEAEVELAAALEALGAGALSIRVLEANEIAARARRRAIESAGRDAMISVAVRADAELEAEGSMDALLLGDALWHQPQPDQVLAGLVSRLRRDGVVLFVDRIAGGAVGLSQTTHEKLAELWQVLPESWTSRESFAATPTAGDDGGVAAPEGDLLAALEAHLTPLSTIGFGHLVDLAVGPTRGSVVSESGAAAEAFLTSIDALDESRSIAEGLPPRHGVGVFLLRPSDTAPGEAPLEVLGSEWPRRSR